MANNNMYNYRRPTYTYKFRIGDNRALYYAEVILGAPKYNPISWRIFLAGELPKWVVEGMQLIDLSVDPATNRGVVPNLGVRYGGTYVFAAEGVAP